jgi:hypothetical protein
VTTTKTTMMAMARRVTGYDDNGKDNELDGNGATGDGATGDGATGDYGDIDDYGHG